MATVLPAFFVSCKDKDEDEVYAASVEENTINFTPSRDGFQIPTRAGVLETFSNGDKVSVLSMMKPNSGAWSKVFVTDAVEITNVGEYLWSYKNKQKWTNGNTYKFRGFYPSSAEEFNTTAGEGCANGFTWTAPVNGTTTLTLNNYRAANDPRQNTDLMVSDVVERTYSKGNDEPVELNMKHLLANVNFNIRKATGKKLTVTGFRVINYVISGECTINDASNPVWNPNAVLTLNQNNVSDYFKVYETDKNGNPTDKELIFNNGLNHNGKTFVLIPNDVYMNSDGTLGNDYQDFTGDDLIENFRTGLLFIPQSLSSERKNVTIELNNGSSINATYTHQVVAEIKYKYDDGLELKASVDLTGNNKVLEWKPGKKYNYTIGVYEYQATANITIEDWTHHTYEEELK